MTDLVLVNANVLTMDPDRIAGLEVLATVVDGVPRYDAGALNDLG